MDAKMVDMKYSGSDCSPCCYDSEYPIGFFLSPKQVEALGIPETIEPDTVMDAMVKIKVKSVTRRTGEVELYAAVTEMGIVPTSVKEDPTSKMAKAYGDDDGGDKA